MCLTTRSHAHQSTLDSHDSKSSGMNRLLFKSCALLEAAEHRTRAPEKSAIKWIFTTLRRVTHITPPTLQNTHPQHPQWWVSEVLFPVQPSRIVWRELESIPMPISAKLGGHHTTLSWWWALVGLVAHWLTHSLGSLPLICHAKLVALGFLPYLFALLLRFGWRATFVESVFVFLPDQTAKHHQPVKRERHAISEMHTPTN